MKNWLYFAMAAYLSLGISSCSDEDYSSDLELLKMMESASAAKLDSLTKAQEELRQKQEELNKQQEELQKLQEKANTNENDYVDTTSAGNTPKKYDDPKWVSVEAVGDYAYTMTVTFTLPTALKESASKNDMIAAFVGKECRGVAKMTQGVFLLDVIGTGVETTPVTFRYWNANNHYMYESLISIPFSSDFIYGVVDDPKTFNCKQK